MAVTKAIHLAKGLWHGKSKLNQSWLAPDKRVTESSSSLHVDIDARDTFATITYDWEYEGKREEGTLILAKHRKSDAVEMAWVDSWHQHDGVLYLKGEASESGSVRARGEYGAGKEVWGWTIELIATADSLTVKMDNCPPTGDPIWAVEGVYTRPS